MSLFGEFGRIHIFLNVEKFQSHHMDYITSALSGRMRYASRKEDGVNGDSTFQP